MHKILLVSDTHGMDNNLYRAIEAEKPLSLIIHCGDIEGKEKEIIERTGSIPTRMIKGNNDFFSTLPAEQEFELCGHYVFLTHGHRYGVNMDLEILKEEAFARKTDIIMFGHTHKPVAKEEDGFYIFNPGSLSYPRQSNRLPSYVVLNMDYDGTINYEIKFLEKN
ncbi:MAG: metallophosphoesterase [Butyrivibrio sp.]|nr:metallophosphoesterase [Butyrivibrio sp.]